MAYKVSIAHTATRGLEERAIEGNTVATSLDDHARLVFDAGRRLVETAGTFEGIRSEIVLLPMDTEDPTAHAFNRIQATLLESMLLQSCALLQKQGRKSDASLRSLARFLDDALEQEKLVAARESWYPQLDYRAGLIDVEKRKVEGEMLEFCVRLKQYEIDDEIKLVRDKAIAHITTDTWAKPLIRKITGIVDDALGFVQLAHDIIHSGDSGLTRRIIFAGSGAELARRAIGGTARVRSKIDT